MKSVTCYPRPEDGNMGLQLFWSLLFGMFFALGYLNVSRYVTATNVVERATRDILRCLTPLEAVCRTSVPAADSDKTWRWYRSFITQSFSRRVKLFDYRATVNRQHWSLELDQYQVKKGIRNVTFPALSVPIKKYLLKPMRENRFVTYQLQLRAPSYYIPDSFPTWDPALEEQLENSSEQRWRDTRNRKQSKGGNNNFDYSRFAVALRRSYHLKPGTVAQIKTAEIAVPSLSNVTSTCGVSNCSVDSLAAHDGNKFSSNSGAADFITTAHLAIKVFTSVRSVGAKRATRIRWSKGFKDGSGDGLFLHADGYPSRALGGRAPSTIFGTSPSWFNLWVRGPKGAHGGDATKTHDDLKVKRGGTFSIEGYLSSDPDSAGAVADVVILYFVDQPKLTEGISRSILCPELKQNPEHPDNCPTLTQCGLQEGSEAITSCNPVSQRTIATCDSVQSFPLSGMQLPTVPLYSFDCQGELGGSAKLSGMSTFARSAIPTEYQPYYCNDLELDRSYSSALTLWAKPDNCPLATTIQVSRPCSQTNKPDYIPCNAGGENSMACNSVAEILATSSSLSTTAPHNSGKSENDPINAPALRPLTKGDLNVTGYTNISFDNEWLPQDQGGNSLTCAYRTRVQFENVLPVYEHTNSTWFPDIGYFLIKSPPAGVTLDSYRPTYTLIDSIRVDLNQDYPFERKPEIEIPTTLSNSSFCSLESTSISTLEERLRFYAKNQLPALVDPELKLSTYANQVGVRVITDSSLCSNLPVDQSEGLLPCTPSEILPTAPITCRTEESLGEFSERDYPFGPDECQSSSNTCFKREGSQNHRFPQSSSNIDIAKATEVGLNSIRHGFPQVQLNCLSPQCTSISISEHPAGELQVDVSLTIPIGFPLAQILGRDSLEIVHQQRDRFETVDGYNTLRAKG